jgi:hypothetical protein
MGMSATVDAQLPESLVLRNQNACRQIAKWAFALHERPVKPHIEDWSVDATDPHDCLPKRYEVFPEAPTASDICQRQ